jgi:hypothetical protein
VTVRPTIEDLSRVTDVMLLISASAEGPLDDADGPKGGRR